MTSARAGHEGRWVLWISLALCAGARVGRAGEGGYSQAKGGLTALLKKLGYDRSVLPQVEAKLTEAENKLYEDPPPKLADEGRYLAEVKRDLQAYRRELPAYESVKKKLEEMLARAKAGEKIPSLHLRLAGIRRTEVDKALASPYMEFRKRELHDLMGEISKASKEAEEARKRGRISAARQKREEEKRKKEEEAKRRLRKLKRARMPKHFLASEFARGTDGWYAYKERGWVTHSAAAPDTEDKGFLVYTHDPLPGGHFGSMYLTRKLYKVRFVPGMIVEARVYRERASRMFLMLYCGDFVEAMAITRVPAKKWVTLSKTITGNCVKKLGDGSEISRKLTEGTAYTLLRVRDLAGYRPGEKGKVYVDYVRILPPPEPEEDQGPSR